MNRGEKTSAIDKKRIHKIFRNNLEWVEKYIKITHPDYNIKKQIFDNKIKRKDANDPNRVKSLLASSLFGLKCFVEVISGDKDSKQDICQELKKEYYEWLAATEISSNNSLAFSELKHFLFEINEILESRGDKIEKDIENKELEIDPNSSEYGEAFNKYFSAMQIIAEEEKDEYQFLVGKTYQEIKCSNNFPGNYQQGKQIFHQITHNHDYQGFNFVLQKTGKGKQPEQNFPSSNAEKNNTISLSVKVSIILIFLVSFPFLAWKFLTTKSQKKKVSK